MATPSSVQSQSSALVAFAEHIPDKLADTLELAQYQQLFDDLKTRLAALELNQRSILDQMSQDVQEEVLVDKEIARDWQVKLLKRIHTLADSQQASSTTPKKASC